VRARSCSPRTAATSSPASSTTATRSPATRCSSTDEQLTIPPTATTGDWELRWQAVDGDDEVWFTDTFAITVKAQIQAEIHFEANGASLDGLVLERGDVLTDMHLEVEIIDNPEDEELKLFYISRASGGRVPGRGRILR
jgi:hypothetical protein